MKKIKGILNYNLTYKSLENEFKGENDEYISTHYTYTERGYKNCIWTPWNYMAGAFTHSDYDDRDAEYGISNLHHKVQLRKVKRI